jgi:hypothetical protein
MQLRRAITLAFVLVAVGPATVGAGHIDECGMVYADYGCRWFCPFALPDRTYLLTRAGWEGQILRISGETAACPGECGPYGPDSCLTTYTIADCPPQDLGCGVIRGFADDLTPCLFWESFRYGWVVLEYGSEPFADGDTVQAVGHLAYTYYNAICMYKPPYLLERTLTACVDTTTQTVWPTWGRLKARYR